MSVSCRHVVGIMKRHLCRHCGLALESYAALRSHLESHTSENEHSYSIAPSGVRLEDPSQTKKTKFSCKCEATFATLPSSTRNTKICTISSKTTFAVVLRSYFTAITRKGSPRYVRTSTERRLIRVVQSSDTTRTRCIYGRSCKTCPWGGTRDDALRTTSDPNRLSCTDRWLRNG